MVGGITIKCRKEEEMILIMIKDTGLGIKEENMCKLFTEFCTIREHVSINPNGTGLGLYLSKKLIKLMNGDITVESIYGEGTEFTIQIPAEQPDSKCIITESTKEKSSDGFQIIDKECLRDNNEDTTKKLESRVSKLNMLPMQKENLKILIVDDDPMNTFIMTEMIKRLSLKSDHASNGKQAVDLVKLSSKSKSYYSIIFMDINMPIMSGIEVLYF